MGKTGVVTNNSAGPAGTLAYTNANLPVVKVSPTSGAGGVAVTISAGGFLPGESVTITYAVTSTSLVTLCTKNAASNGSVACSAHIPKTGAVGAHKITAKGATTAIVATTAFTRK
jgi:hypothetical protein